MPTIAGAALHHMSMSHQRYTTWASMMVYRMRAHEQCLNTSMEEAGKLYNRAFHSTSWAIRRSHATVVCIPLGGVCFGRWPKSAKIFPNG